MSKYIPGNQKHLTLDDGSQNESMSISNQKLMLKDYAEKNSMPLKARNTEKFIRGIYNHYDDFIELLAKLEPPLDKRFIEIMDEQLDVIPYEFSEMFIDGFKLGQR